ncbi:MAG TPA: diguanylate cyclase [Burkholderiaceae bacterium]
MSLTETQANPSLPTRGPLTILVVDDHNATRLTIASELDRNGHCVLEADSAEWALELFQRHKPDLVLLDIDMPGHDGYWTARTLREAEPGGWTPIIFMTDSGGDECVWRGIEAGADDYLSKPISPLLMHAKLRAMQRIMNMRKRLVELSDELRTANSQLTELSQLDPLTGLLNRRGLDLQLQTALAHSRRERQPLTVMLCDIDFFKRYNDSLGHLEGDACLRRMSRLLANTCQRPLDCAARYGGEEFALILPDTPRSGAQTFARAVMRMVQLAAVTHPASEVAPYVTLSGGITTCMADDSTTAEALLLRADDALYTAKMQGRNRFFSYEMKVTA